jgi:hypothetical protein
MEKNSARAILVAALTSVSMSIAGASRADVISYSGNITSYTVPSTGFYDVTAAGAGGETLPSGGPNSGSGEIIEDTFRFTAGETLNVLVGGQGVVNGSNDFSGGGGGGTFVVVQSSQTPVLVAGGGGGAGEFDNGGSALDPSAPGSGNGGPGGAASGSFFAGAGGGGGFSGAGVNGANDVFNSSAGTGGQSFAQGGAGGAGGVVATGPNAVTAGSGGFGAGGGAGVEGGGGGGGGYTGGGGGSGGGGGLGGTSYDAGPAYSILGSSGGNGSVTITPADVVTFVASGTFVSGAPLGGTVTIDTTRGVILSADLTLGGPDNFTFNTPLSQTVNGNAYTLYFDDGNPSDILQLNLQGDTTLVGFDGDLNVTGAAEVGSTFDQLDNGELVVVPEPATGAIVVMGSLLALSRRRTTA